MLIRTVKQVQNENLMKKLDLYYLSVVSFFIQLFWLGYGVSGNPFYYIEQRVMYFCAIAIMLYVENAYKMELNHEKEK